jgi:cyanophycin synthetase
VREDDDTRGRAPGECTRLITEGIHAVHPDLPVTPIRSEVEAIMHGLKKAKKNELVVILADNIPRAIQLVTQYKEQLTPVELTHADIPNLNEEIPS